MKKEELEKKIDTALESFDHACRVGPAPFFYTRVLAQLQKKDRTLWEKISVIIARPVVAFTVICLIISLNTLVIFQGEAGSITTDQNSFALSDDSELDTIAFYDDENNNTEPQ